MSTFRRVVTGHNGRGPSIIASDQQVTGVAVPGMPGIELTALWGSDRSLHYPDGGSIPKFATWFAPVGGFRLIEFTIGRDDAQGAADHDSAATRAAVDRLFPGLMDTMDPSVPGMHRSATIDLLYVLSGTCNPRARRRLENRAPRWRCRRAERHHACLAQSLRGTLPSAQCDSWR
jgi:hypothetical protein